MAITKNALIRYKTIDKCLQNHYRTWTLEDLIEACSNALYEYENRDVNVSKRSIQLDIQLMRSDKLGYNAPIVVYDKKYYKYDDENYSITNIPLNETDMNVLAETVAMLKQFKDFSLFSELDGIIQRLEDKVHSEKTNQAAIIHLDKNEHLKGLHFLDVVYQAILKRICILITYQSFKADAASEFSFKPLILKEFNNRWFLVGKRNPSDQIVTLALDRINKISMDLATPYLEDDFNGDVYYKDTVGVTVLNRVEVVTLKIDQTNAPYVLTKPFHHSQELLKTDDNGAITIQLKVTLNYEFERLVLGFGHSIEVLAPPSFRRQIKHNLKKSFTLYNSQNSG